MKRQLCLYWFSGSGNTLRAATAFANRLEHHEWNVKLYALERSDPRTIDPETVLGLAFPTHCFTIPEIVLSFVRSLPQVEGTEAIMLGTHGGFSGGVVGPMKRELTAKGFRCTAARILVIPDNFFPFWNDETNRRTLERSLNNAKCYADEVAARMTRWTRLPILSDIYAFLCRSVFASRKLSRKYFSTVHVQKENCRRCGTCVRLCPVSALVQHADTPPHLKKNCTNCLRCVAVCPTDAMRHMVGFRPYRSEEATALAHRLEQAMVR